jgi:hypothetical protein
LYQWVGVSVDGEGFIYVTDAMDYSLKKFDAQGKLVKKTGRKGQGPGEFMAPRALVSSGNRLFVTDQSVPGIQVFDNDLKYEKHIPLNLLVTEIAALSDHELACKAFETGRAPRILIIGDDGRVVSEIGYGEKNMPMMMDLVDFAASTDGFFYLAYSHMDRLEKLSAGGRAVWTKELLGVNRVKTDRVSSFVVPTQIVYKDIALDRSGHIFILGGSFSKNPGRDVYVLSGDGDILATFTLPETSHCLFIDERNSLYVRANEGITLKKYKLSYKGI